ncbi:MAG: alginate export family protein, partial [Actinomycetota bacterium]
MEPMQRRIALAGLALVLGTKAAQADMTLVEQDGLKIDAALAVGAAAIAAPNANFGAGTYRNAAAGVNTGPAVGGRISGGPEWAEGFVKPELKATYDRDGIGTLYGDVSVVAAGTLGDGDANLINATHKGAERVAIEDLYAGWRSGSTLPALGTDALDLSAGRQTFRIADGFLVADGTLDTDRRGAFWLQPRTAFAETAVLKVNTSPVRGDLFYLKNDSELEKTHYLDQPSTALWGANVEWFQSKEGKDARASYDDRKLYVGATFLQVFDADSRGIFSFRNAAATTVTNSLWANRDGLRVYSVHAGGSPLPMHEDFTLFAQGVLERNDDGGRKVRADAWYVEPGYAFSALPWTPAVSFRYAQFSGDDNPNDTTDKS